jgi:signal peptidase II
MNRYTLFSVLAILGFVLDQWSKHWARTSLSFGHKVPVFDPYWFWQLSYNKGSAFGLLGSTSGAAYILSAIGIGAAIAIIVMLVRASDRQKWMVSALALVFSGAVGNVVDRIREGKVTDFVLWEIPDVYSHPVFNLADVWLVAGVIILFFDFGKDSKKK